MTLFTVTDSVSGMRFVYGAFPNVSGPLFTNRLLWSSLSMAADTAFLSPDPNATW